jgi:hypothetical protein
MDKRIDEIQMDEDEYFVYLKKGYCLYLGKYDIQHCFGVRKKSEIKEEMKNVEKCKCDSCLKVMEVCNGLVKKV